MAELFKNFDALTMLLWLVPGAFIAFFRSFGLRGSFPSIGKDDLAALLLGSVVYYFVTVIVVMGRPIGSDPALLDFPRWLWFAMLVVFPSLLGLGLGMLEASDLLGRGLRRCGFNLPSPNHTAWETIFREMPRGAVILVTLKDGAVVVGRWWDGRGGSAASSDTSSTDLYIGEIGGIDDEGRYVPKNPRRGIYISAGEIRFFEVIRPS